MTDAPKFPETLWPKIKERMEQGGATAVVALAEEHADPTERRKALSFALSALSSREWAGKSLDGIIEVGRAAIAEGLRQSEAAPPDDRNQLLDFANILSYNLASTLAPCWVGDTLPRERRHFEAGLRAADDCLRWRHELKKGPRPFFIAHWARAIHLSALGRDDEALVDYEESLRQGELHATEEGASTEVAPDGHWAVLLGAGYAELGRMRAKGGGREAFARVIGVIREGVATHEGEEAEELQFCVDQLLEAERRLA